MPFAAGVKFTQEDFPKYFNPGDLNLAVDDFCVAKDPDIGLERVGFIACLEGRAGSKAARFLGTLGDPAVAALRTAAASDPDPEVRRGAQKALARMGK